MLPFFIKSPATQERCRIYCRGDSEKNPQFDSLSWTQQQTATVTFKASAEMSDTRNYKTTVALDCLVEMVIFWWKSILYQLLPRFAKKNRPGVGRYMIMRWYVLLGYEYILVDTNNVSTSFGLWFDVLMIKWCSDVRTSINKNSRSWLIWELHS